MVTNNFEYHRAESIDDAITLMVKHGMEAKLLAGGHSLLPAMKLRLNQPGVLIDIRRLPDFRYIKQEGHELIIGAGATHGDIASSALVQRTMAMLSEAADLIGDVQVRNVGTLGGSLAHADPSADWPAVMLAADAVIRTKGPKGERRIKAADFFTGFFETALAENELITAIHIPVLGPGAAASYQKFMQPASRFAIVGCAVKVTIARGLCEDIRVAFTGLSENAFRATNIEQALGGKALTEANIEQAVADPVGDRMVLSDHFASEEYRTHLARVYAKRALLAAAG
jgi:aerobic carbon-monoxide dehydrogenase medium subunit